ncbi:LytR/AlgR family response regulator transcription factor [Acanthopleuribacter pedis]|uniref:Response regulator transcription factor n=1 Tax=Acanthopleuribacter pedis TaxID=442870 RepID=A0A8J7Q970_9BACT|nr:LytTR family DNA-binding domain-containing protein [Acanthopleuribacter pedis]MBO1319249.1 response regulator transcription factor [Acanthopleuribacter pedis]
MKVLIVDDEALAREAVRLRLATYADVTIVGEADNGSDALVLIDHLQPDTVFLDIEMPGGNGLDLAKAVADRAHLKVVFITAYANYAHQAFRVDAVDYLLKPIRDDQFADMMAKCRRRPVKTAPPRPSEPERYLARLALKEGEETHMVPVTRIESIVSAGDYLCIRVFDDRGTKVFIHRATLKKLETLLDPNLFQRCHRSHLVNIQRIGAFTREPDTLVALSGEAHPVSRRFLARVKSRFPRLGQP